MADHSAPSVLIAENLILNRVREIATQIQRDYEGRPLTVLGIFNGSFIFLADLLRNLSLPLQMDSMVVSSYRGKNSTGMVQVQQCSERCHLSDHDILVVDDILETGLTLEAIQKHLLDLEPMPRSIEFCILLRKNCPRKCEINARYVGFDIANEFVVGYGLDFNGQYRNLPYIGVLQV
jgi:hypoxanthine phosphoribosyltransferase